MRFLLIAIALFVSTTAQANDTITLPPDLNGIITLTPYDETPCSKTDVAVGIGAGVVAGVAIGVAAVATSPLIGPGVAAGSTVGWVGAFSAPFLTNATAMSVGMSTVIVGPIVGTVGYYTSCITRNVW